MKGAIIAAQHPGFIEDAAAILGSNGYHVLLQPGVLQISDEGRLLTFYGGSSGLKSSFPELDEIQDRGMLKDKTYACLADCRWEDLFCRTLKDLAQAESKPFVVIDNDGVVWDPATLDPARVQL